MKRQLMAVLLAAALAAPVRADDKGDFKPLFDGKTLTGWKSFPSGHGTWKVDDGAILGTGKASHLFTERDDYGDFHLRAEIQINDGGNSGMYFRTKFGPGFPKGYEAQINSTHRDPVKTGSLYRFDPKQTAKDLAPITVKEQLVKPGEWFKYEVIAKGNHIVIKVNDKETVNFKDEKKTHTKGHIAFQQHHEGSEVRVRKVEIKELSD